MRHAARNIPPPAAVSWGRYRREVSFVGEIHCRPDRRVARCSGARLGALFSALLATPVQAEVLDVAVQAAAGGPAAGREVTLRNAGTGFAMQATTSADGRVRFDGVPTGTRYAILVDGTTLAEDVSLRASEAKSITLTLLEEVVVRAARRQPLLNALDAEIASALDQAELEALPVEARDLARALVRLPNVAPSTGFFPEAPGISINGANGLYAQYLIDGLDNNENFLGGPKFPISTGFASSVSVLAGGFSAEYGRTGNGVVNVTSRSGTNEWTGEAFYLVRPGQPPDSASPYPGLDLSGNQVKDGFERDQFGAGLGGPIVRDQTFVYANVEYTRDRKDNRLSSPALGVNTTVPGENRSLLASLRIDHRPSEAWRLTFRGNRSDVEVERQGGGLDGGVTFPSAGSTQDRLSTLAAFSAVYSDERITSETNLGYSRFRWNYGRPAGGPSPQVTVESPDGLVAAVVGHPGFAFDDLERSWQLQQKLTWTVGRHSLTAGADGMYSQFELTGGGNPLGNYRVRLTAAELAALAASGVGGALDVDDLPATAEVLDYAVELRPSTFGRPQRQLGLFVQDQVALSAATTLTAGLRWDYDSVTRAGSDRADLGNVAPRFAINHTVSPTLVLRAGGGLYYDRIPYAILSDALQQNTTSSAFRAQLAELVARGLLPADTDLDRVTFDGNLVVNPPCPDGFLQCPTPDTVPGLRDIASSSERRILSPDGLDSPYSVQWTAGLQWQFAGNFVASADAIVVNGHRQLRLRDLNAPTPFTPNLANLTSANVASLRAIQDPGARQGAAAALGLVRLQPDADATRPIAVRPGGARQIVVTESAGRSRYRALNLQLRKELGLERYGVLLSYTLSKLENDTDDLNFRASNSNEFGSEFGPSVNDRRHVLSAVLFLRPHEAVTLTVAGLFQSGQPINYIPDAAIFGTTDINGDGASFSTAYLGNSDRAPDVSRNSGRLPWAKSVDVGLRFAPRVGAGRVEISADVFNVFDRTNLSGFSNSATQSNQIQVFGTPFVERNAGPPRQFQFGVRYFF